MTTKLLLRKKIVCPHCWHVFSPEATLAVSACRELTGDIRLGANAAKRFLPNRFDINGVAIDERGYKCQFRACPNCHLVIPENVFYGPSIFISIVGAQAAGKSYFLTSMTYKLRSLLPQFFQMSFTDSDAQLNAPIISYESRQFENDATDVFTLIEKTQPDGDNYNTVQFDHPIRFLKPYLFTLQALEGHPQHGKEMGLSTLCLYDNAGESYDPGEDQEDTPFTRHLKYCHAIFFLLDPLQDSNFRQQCSTISNDPQLDLRNQRQLSNSLFMATQRQENIFQEMVRRFRFLRQIAPNQKTNIPLIVVVTKFDIWSSLIGVNDISAFPPCWNMMPSATHAGVNSFTINMISDRVKALIEQYMPTFCASTQQLFNNIHYIPVSATGCSPTKNEQGLLAFRPCDLKPVWNETPMLYCLKEYNLLEKMSKAVKI
ncbi:MAG: hypothetical protein IJF84_11100 [Thermoguttaceae bacterium]|nr:hypothetical protein [Thermoguttaceae bacterium]